MTDFISRNALIEDLKWLKSVVNESSKNEVQDFIDRVDSFPSAEVWIPVSGRLPEQYETVIGWDGHFMGEVEHNGEEFVWIDDDGWNNIAEITHWMPMPEPPKGVKK